MGRTHLLYHVVAAHCQWQRNKNKYSLPCLLTNYENNLEFLQSGDNFATGVVFLFVLYLSCNKKETILDKNICSSLVEATPLASHLDCLALCIGADKTISSTSSILFCRSVWIAMIEEKGELHQKELLHSR